MTKRLVVLVAAALTLSGCALGFDAGTNVKVIPGNGASYDADGIQIRGAGIVIDKANPNNGTFIGTVINRSEAEFSVVGISGASVTQSGDVSVAVASGAIAQFGYESGNTIALNGDFTPGHWVDVQLLLNGAKPVSLHVMVNNNDGVYEDVVVPGAPAPSAMPSL
jgi:hypothetical protein